MFVVCGEKANAKAAKMRIPMTIQDALSVAAKGILLLAAVSLAVNAAAPTGRYTINVDTVVDTQTHLTWQRAVAPSTYTWSAASAYCAALSLGGFSSGWRLPTVKELQSILDKTTSNPAIDSAAFPSTPSSYFWSSSPYVSAAGGYWVVDFSDGSNAYNTSVSFNIRCVR